MKTETFESHFDAGAEPKVGQVMSKIDGSNPATVVAVEMVKNSKRVHGPSWGNSLRVFAGGVFRVTVSKP